MTSILRSVVTGVGGYLPADVVTNDDLAKFVDTNDAWIVERTGIRSAPPRGGGRGDLRPGGRGGAKGPRRTPGARPADVDLIVVATTTPDLTFPATATIVQRKLGAPVGIAFDVQAVCSGFVYALAVADNFVARGQAQLRAGHRRRDHDPADGLDRPRHLRAVRRRRRRRGAGAEARARGPPPTAACSVSPCAPTATKQDLLYVDGGPSTTGTVGKLRMQGNQVFRHAVVNIAEAVRRRRRSRRASPWREVDWFIPHQANQRILEGVAQAARHRR